jgi:hypothetical protein
MVGWRFLVYDTVARPDAVGITLGLYLRAFYSCQIIRLLAFWQSRNA